MAKKIIKGLGFPGFRVKRVLINLTKREKWYIIKDEIKRREI